MRRIRLADEQGDGSSKTGFTSVSYLGFLFRIYSHPATLDLCRRRKAVLVISKLDHLVHSVHFTSGLMESGAGHCHGNRVSTQNP